MAARPNLRPTPQPHAQETTTQHSTATVDDMANCFNLRRCLSYGKLLQLAALPLVLPQSITIDWTVDSATGISTPSLRGSEIAGEEKSDDVVPTGDDYEHEWWAGGFAEDTEKEWFAASRVPRGERPQSMVRLGHQIGTVYRHSLTGAFGVIVGWDARTRAPRSWLPQNLPGERSWADRIRRLHAPHYSVLEEMATRDGGRRYQQRYIVAFCREEGEAADPCLEVMRPVKAPTHPDIPKYFDSFRKDSYGFPTEDGEAASFRPHPWLRTLYPHG